MQKSFRGELERSTVITEKHKIELRKVLEEKKELEAFRDENVL